MKTIFILASVLFASFAHAQVTGDSILPAPNARIFFATNQYRLTEFSQDRLDSLLNSLPPGALISLYGHCDYRASDGYNQRLSNKRVNTVKNYLLQNGLKPKHLVNLEGFGESKPWTNSKNPVLLYKNRRVDVTVLIPETSIGNEIVTELSDTMAVRSLQSFVADSNTQKGSSIVLRNMNFYGGTHVILPESLSVLLELLDVMKQHPQLEIAVEGHICCMDGVQDGLDIGTRTYNLSENRAWEICKYLTKNGIAASRLKYKGFGHAQPLYPYPEKSETERSQNRRVEIRILKK